MPAKLPQELQWQDADNKWAAILNPVIGSAIVNGLLLNSIALNNGVTVINHRLGRKLQGWLIVGINGAAQVYDNQATNQMPQLTLSLTSNAEVIISLWVF